MDGHRFDYLARLLAQSIGRRQAAGLLSSLAFAALIDRSAPDAEARKRRRRKKKQPPAVPPPGSPPVSPPTSPPPPPPPPAGCNPPCPAGRSCYQGTCTCTSSAQCANERNPRGFDCVGAPGNPSVTICGCTQFAGQNRRVCTAGEPCSTCCSDQECRDRPPGFPNAICATIPANGLVGRSCCDPPGSPCSNICCSVITCASGSQCGCRGEGQACGQNEQCCSRQCGYEANPFKCAPVGSG
jgi:hypothetical protein